METTKDIKKDVLITIKGTQKVGNEKDVIEMMYAGASAVAVGSANLVDPYACKRIIDTLPEVMARYGIQSLEEIIGRSHRV